MNENPRSFDEMYPDIWADLARWLPEMEREWEEAERAKNNTLILEAAE